jgi:GNAT superfamily N-acetyltransferase
MRAPGQTPDKRFMRNCDPPEVVVPALVVDQAVRDGGVGRAMMAAAEAWAKDRGFTSVALASNATNWLRGSMGVGQGCSTLWNRLDLKEVIDAPRAAR